MSAKLVMVVLSGIIIMFLAFRYYPGAIDFSKQQCPPQDRQPLPGCAERERTGSNVTVMNHCDFPITVHWEVTGGSDLVYQLDPGTEKRVTTYPLKVTSIKCCADINFCY